MTATALLVFTSWLFVRNLLWGRYALRLLDRVHQAATADIECDRPWEWRYARFEQVSHTEGLFKVFSRFDALYENDLSFADKDGRP